jgi:hypothetical protein
MEQVLTNQYPRQDYYYGILEDSRNIFIGFGRWLQNNGIGDFGSIKDYVDYLNVREIELKEKQIKDFFDKLKTGDFKVILINGQTPLMKDDGISEDMINLIIGDLDNNSEIGSNDDAMVIHTEIKTIKLNGYKNMSDEEVFARKYLDTCEYGDLIIKDSLEQDEFRDDNFVNDIMDYYNKCKDIVNIRTVLNDCEHYNMNWDCIIVEFTDGEEIWQRA